MAALVYIDLTRKGGRDSMQCYEYLAIREHARRTLAIPRIACDELELAGRIDEKNIRTFEDVHRLQRSSVARDEPSD